MQIYGSTFETANTLGDDLSSSNRETSQALLSGSLQILGDYYASSSPTSEPESPDVDTVSLNHSSCSVLESDARSEKIAQLKALISNGAYHVTATAVAGKMMAAAKADAS